MEQRPHPAEPETRPLTDSEQKLLSPLFSRLCAKNPVRVVDRRLNKEYDVFLFTRGGVRLLVKRSVPRRREAEILRTYFRGTDLPAVDMLEEISLDGETWRLFPFVSGPDARGCSPAGAAEVGEALARIHRRYLRPGGVTAEAENYFRWPQSRYERVLTFLPELAEVWEGARARFFAAPQTLVHDDLLPINVLLGRAGPMFLDWETAGIWPYFLDLARFALVSDGPGTFYISPEAAQAFFDAYYRAMAPDLAVPRDQYAVDIAVSALYQYISFLDGGKPPEEVRAAGDFRILTEIVRYLRSRL